MNQPIIRKPKPTETETIIRIWLEGNTQAHSFIQPDYWLSHVEYMRQTLPLSEVYVCEVAGEIAGFIGLEDNHIAGLFVNEQHQSQGCGTSLIDCIKQQHFTLTLTVYRKNEKALQFYRQQNFVAMGERIDTNTNEEDLLMRWNRACPI